ncbi:hypothetical protein BKA70DRAFT_1560399 [Coprinopsis sp. MPI-PUGE-AT-0042]|nr:hypothetical protein BKA70DRAFT_1560399 [Coprinopsis sp. MPI-PUGE-AT-0042]
MATSHSAPALARFQQPVPYDTSTAWAFEASGTTCDVHLLHGAKTPCFLVSCRRMTKTRLRKRPILCRQCHPSLRNHWPPIALLGPDLDVVASTIVITTACAQPMLLRKNAATIKRKCSERRPHGSGFPRTLDYLKMTLEDVHHT